MSTERNLRKTRVGKVVSDKMDKTVLRLTMRRMSAESATALRSWKHVRFQKIRDGV